MNKQQKKFDIHPYKIDKIYSQTAKKIYKQITNKYLITNQLQKQNFLWHQNQRKIFIWFIVCYFYQIKSDDPIQAQINWQDLSIVFFDKNPQFLKFQFLNIIKIKKRIIWTSDEDQLLVKAFLFQGIGKWNEISKSLYFQSKGLIFKTPKHCRQRWLNHLDNNKSKGEWTIDEDYKIFLYVRQYGGKWSKIVQTLNHKRTEHMVKNRFNSLLTKYRKNKKQKDTETIDKILKILGSILTNNKQEQENTQIVAQQQKQKQYIPNQKMQQAQNQQIYDKQLAFKHLYSFQTKKSESIQCQAQITILSPGAFYPHIKTINTNQFLSKQASGLELLSINGLRSVLKPIQQKPLCFEPMIAEKIEYKIKPVHIIIKN